jgi:hypothetical protein
MPTQIKLSKKHKQIISKIREKGRYKPTYSDQEPATKTLIKNGIIEWKPDFTGFILTDFGKSIDIN